MNENAAPRYRCVDEHTGLEIRTRYEAGDTAARIALMQEVFDSGGQLPYDIAVAAATTDDIGVRVWLARYAAELTYYSESEDRKEPERVWPILEADEHPLIRLALLENPHYPEHRFFHPTIKDFQEQSHIERLASLRNPAMASHGVADVVLAIFDLTNDAITSSPKERSELAFAYLTNEAAVRQSHDFEYPSHIRYDISSYEFEKEREKLWQLAATFPDHTVRWFALRYLGAKDDWKAATYKSLISTEPPKDHYDPNADFRRAILLNCTEKDYDTLKLGAGDSDDNCREIASQKAYVIETEHSWSWRVIRHAWGALQNLVALGLIIAVLGSAETRFEKILIAALAYLFLIVTTFSTNVFATYFDAAVSLDAQFERLRKLLGEKTTPRENRWIAQQRDELRWNVSTAKTDRIINSVFHLLAWIVVLVALIRGLLS